MKVRDQLLSGLAIGLVLVPGLGPDTQASPAAPAHLHALQTGTSLGRNSVSGNVFGDSNRPLPDLNVELLDDVGRTISRTKTNGAGRYSFFSLPNGLFKIRVLPYGTDYLEQTRNVGLIPVSASAGSGAESQQVDFYLKLKAGVNEGPLYAPGTVFVQEVPETAKKFYDKAVVELREKKEKEGFESLRRSLEIFPTYYDALNRLGTEYVVRGPKDKSYFEAAYVLLSKAVEVNPNSFSSSFGLGFSQYHLGLVDQSIPNFQRAVSNYSKWFKGHLWLGIALKRAGKLEQAETSLKRADELSKGKEADVHWHLAQLYNDQKRYIEAASELELFLKDQPADSPEAAKIRQMIAKLREKASK